MNMIGPGPASRFQVEGVVVRDAQGGANFAYITIREGEKQYWDVACFEDGPLDQFRNLRSGAVAKIRGHLGKRKMRDVVDQQGRAKYEIQLIAERVEARAPVMPMPQPYPQQGLGQSYHQQLAPQVPMGVASQGAGWAAGPNFPNPQWPQPGQAPYVPMAQAGAPHPASSDASDDIDFP